LENTFCYFVFMLCPFMVGLKRVIISENFGNGWKIWNFLGIVLLFSVCLFLLILVSLCSRLSAKATWRSSLPGATTTGRWPTRASPSCATTCTCRKRLCRRRSSASCDPRVSALRLAPARARAASKRTLALTRTDSSTEGLKEVNLGFLMLLYGSLLTITFYDRGCTVDIQIFPARYHYVSVW